MQAQPKIGSHKLVLCIFSKILIHTSRKVLPATVMPKMSFTCDVMITKATADVNPEDTGPDTKSTINPENLLLYRVDTIHPASSGSTLQRLRLQRNQLT